MAAIIIAGLAVIAAVLIVVRQPERWPPPEVPPRQGEAVDPSSLHDESPTHSAAALARLIREPQNTWSNIAFLVGGAFLMTRRCGRAVVACGAVLVAVGLGSALYHASASRTLRHFDVGAMFWLFLMLALLALSAVAPRLRRPRDRHAFAMFALTLVVAVFLTIGRNVRIFEFKPFSLTIATGTAATVVGLAVGWVALRSRSPRMILRASATVALFLVALACQIGDRPGEWWCAPDAAVQAHAVWHVLAAIATVSAVLFLSSAPPVAPTHEALRAEQLPLTGPDADRWR